MGANYDTGDYGKMYFNRTLEDWIGFKINDRTKYDLTISSGLALLAAQKVKQKPKSDFEKQSFSADIRPSADLLYLQKCIVLATCNKKNKLSRPACFAKKKSLQRSMACSTLRQLTLSGESRRTLPRL